MKILENKNKLDILLADFREKKKKIALIPTMGAIHEGHLSLIQKSKKLDFFSVVTIFVNPTQFNDLDDYIQYPKDLDTDVKFLEKVGADLLFLPLVKDLYPDGVKSEKTILDYRNILCDEFRHGHFDGVTTVVKALFDLVKPDHTFFGEKDFQQLKLIQKIIEKNKLSIILHPCISIRMSNGISYSSRYNNFKPYEILFLDKVAVKIKNSIERLKKSIDEIFLEDLKEELKIIGINKIDYVEVRNENTLFFTRKNKNARLFVAFHIGNIRIIDNFILY